MRQEVSYMKIGRLGKSFGKDGAMRCTIDADKDKLTKKLSHVYVWVHGQYLPYFIKKVDIDQDSLLLEEVTDIQLANVIAHKDIFISSMQADFSKFKKAKIDENALIGFEVIDENSGLSATIKSIVEYPSQTMLICSDSNGSDIMIPFVEDWLVDIDPTSKTISMDLPRGLMNDEEE